MYTKHSSGPHGRCKTTVWSQSSMRSCPVRHKAQVAGGQCWGRKRPASRLRTAVVLTPATFHTPYLSPQSRCMETPTEIWGSLPQMLIATSFRLSSLNLSPVRHPPLASGQSRPPRDLYVALSGHDLWPFDAADLEHWLGWCLQASTAPVYAVAHGSTWSHVIPDTENLAQTTLGCIVLHFVWLLLPALLADYSGECWVSI